MTDIASLSFSVDSAPAQSNFLALANSAAAANLSVGQFMAGIAGGSAQLSQLAASLQTVVTTMQQARTALDGSAASFEVFAKARSEAALLGGILGTTATGLEQFTRQASALHMTATQTATSLERITTAIEGQSAAARQLRTIMQDYGVSLQGITASNADQILLKFAERVRQFQMTPGSIQSIQQVLGPLDPAALAQVTASPITTNEARATQLKIEQVNRDAAATTDAAAVAYAQLRQGFEQLRALQGNTGAVPGIAPLLPLPAAVSGGAYNLGRLSSQQQEQLNQGAGLVGAPDTAATQLARMRYLDTQAPQALRDAARNPWPDRWRTVGNAFLDPFTLFHPGRDFSPGAEASRDATNAANAANIEARRGEDRTNTTGFGSTWFGSGINRDLRRLQNNLWGGYTPTNIDSGPTLPVDPGTLRDRRLGLGGQLAGYGSPDYQRSVGAGISVEALMAGGTATAPSEAERAYIQAYSAIGGPGMMAGSQRYQNQLDITTRARDQALTPGAAELNALALQRYILSQPRDQQAQAQQLLTFAGQQGVSTGAIASRNLSPADLMAGRATGPGALATDQAAGFRGIQSGQSENFITQSRQDLAKNLADERELQAVIPQGTAAMQQRLAMQTALNQAVTAGLNPQAQRIAQFRAEQETIEQQNTAGLKALDILRKTIEAEDDRQRAADQFSGADPIGRSAASIQSQTQAQIDEFTRRNPGQGAQYAIDRATQLRQQALGSGSDALAGAQSDVANQQRLVDISRQRIDLQQQLNNEHAVELDFRQRLANAEAADKIDPTGGTAVALLRAEMLLVVELKGKYDELVQAKKNNDAASQTGVTAALQEYRNTLSPAEQRRFDASRRTIEDNVRSGSGLTGNREADLDAIRQRESAGGTQLTNRQGPGGTPLSTASGDFHIIDGTWQRYRGRVEGAGQYARAIDAPPEMQREVARRIYDNEGSAPWAASDPTRARAREMMGGGGTPSQRALIEREQRNREAAEAGQNTDAQRAADYQRARTAAVTGVSRDGGGQFAQAVAGARVVDPTSATGAADARRRETATLDEFNQRRAQLFAGNEREARDGARLLAATQEGTMARQQMVVQLGAEQTARELGITGKDADLLKTDQLTLAIQRQRQAIAEGVQARKDENQLLQATIDAGPFASPQALGTARARVLAEQESNTLGGRDFDTAFSERQANETRKQQVSDVQELRASFLQMESAAMGAFENAIVGGQKLSTVLQSLVQDLAKLALRAAIEKPLMDMFNQMIGGTGGGAGSGAASAGSGILGFFGKLFGGSTALGAESIAQAAAVTVATGGVINRGRYMAAGGMIDRPTTFAVEGGAVTAGESGAEAIMPLKRLPSGNLGVASQGGGGGHSIVVNAPITVSGSATGKEGMDPAAARQIQAQLQQVMADAMRSMIINELRDGGDIRTQIGG